MPAVAVSGLGLLLSSRTAGCRLPGGGRRPRSLLALDFATLPFADTVWRDVPVENPLAVFPRAAYLALEAVAYPAWVLGTAVGSAAVVARRRRATGAHRQRYRLVIVPAVAPAAPSLGWVLAGLVAAVTFVGLGEWEAQRVARDPRPVRVGAERGPAGAA